MQRRRWLLWAAAGLAGAVAVFLGLALLLGEPPGRFAFLEGHDPIPAPDSGWTFYTPYSRLSPIAHYSFEADFSVLSAVAGKELLARGYHDLTPSGAEKDIVIFSSEAVPVVRPTRSRPQIVSERIMIQRDTRYVERGGTLDPVPAEGWIIVTISGDPPKTLFDRVREWIGALGRMKDDACRLGSMEAWKASSFRCFPASVPPFFHP